MRAAELFLRFGADVNVVDNNDYTPLLLAAAANDCEMVRLLLSHGATVLRPRRSNGEYTALILRISKVSVKSPA